MPLFIYAFTLFIALLVCKLSGSNQVKKILESVYYVCLLENPQIQTYSLSARTTSACGDSGN